MARLRILFLARRYPHPLRTGGHWRTFGFVKGLARHADVVLACFGTGPPLPLDGVRVETVGARPGSRRVLGPDGGHIALANARHPGLRLPLHVRLSLDDRMDRLVERELTHFRPHVVHAMPSVMAPHLPAAGSCHRHLDLNDSLAVSIESQAAFALPPLRPLLRAEARLLRRYESAAAQAADSCSLAADWDRHHAPGLGGARILPPGVDLESFPYVSPLDRPPRLIFFGFLAYFPNAQVAEYLASEVMPRLRERVPEATLRIVGGGAGRRVRRLEAAGVRVVGPVEDMAAELRAASVALLPSFSGAGIKTKVQEAFSAGTPVVANRTGVAGLASAEAGRHYGVGESAEELAASCAQLLTDGQERVRLAEEARRLVERFTWDRQVDELLDIYRRGGLVLP